MSQAQKIEAKKQLEEESFMEELFTSLGEPTGFNTDNQGIRIHQVFAY